MLVDKEFLNNLRQAFNLNLYEVKLWTALLSRGISTAGELSDMADVPRSRTYDVLESLERKGFVVIKTEKPIKYIAISPHEVLDRVKRKLKLEADNRTTRLDALSSSEVLTELKQLYEQGIEPMNATDFSGALKGRHNIYDHLSMIIKEAEKSVNIMTTADGFVRKIRSLKTVLERANARGVAIKIATPVDESTKAFAEQIGSLAEIRSIKEVTARFCVVDKKQLIFMLLDDKETHPTYDLAMWVNTPYFASALSGMFDRMWTTGENIGGTKLRAPEPTTETSNYGKETELARSLAEQTPQSIGPEVKQNAYNEVTNTINVGEE